MSDSGRAVEVTCVRALARACGARSRQQARAAARRFVRRHRRDARYLEWVLRHAGASSAFAAALLGFGASPASGEAAGFVAIGGHSFEGIDFGGNMTPALGDLDGDGDPDMVAGQGDFLYFENTGSATSPAFVLRTGPQSPLDGHDISFSTTPALGDLDGDGDLDLLSGRFDGSLAYLENTGSATSAAFVARTGAQNPLNGQIIGNSSSPALGDVDSDGDLDLVVGERYGAFAYFENTGTAASPAFARRTGSQNPIGDFSGTLNTAPALGDVDGDGDLDLVSGEYFDSFWYYENTGSATSPAFLVRTGADSPVRGLNVGAFSSPALGDLDGDGDPDMIAGDNYGLFAVFEHLGGRMVQRTGSANPLVGQDVGLDAYPSLGDLDGDGDLDLVAGRAAGDFAYFQNTGSAAIPAFAARTGGLNPLDGQDVGSSSTPSLGDLDGDGDLDLVSGQSDGSFFYFANTGSSNSPAFAARTGALNPLDGRDVGTYSAPALGDVDGDGDLDLVSGQSSGSFFYFENTGSAASAAFVARTGAQNPLADHVVGSRAVPLLGDIDNDGDLDVFSGEQGGAFFHFENTGSATNAEFTARTGRTNPLAGADVGSRSTASLGDLDGDGDLDLISGESGGAFATFESFVPRILSASRQTGDANPLDGQDVGAGSSPALADLDGDGDLDLVAGGYGGAFFYFENTGDAVTPRFVSRTGALNPLDGEGVGDGSAPALGDLDGDGDVDLVAGALSGTFFYYENTGTATNPEFASRTGSANPLDGEAAYSRSAVALGDLDRDGDLDFVVGHYYGGFVYFENTGSATAPEFIEAIGPPNPLAGVDIGLTATPALGDLDRDGDLDLLTGRSDGALLYFKNQGSATGAHLTQITGGASPLAGQDLNDFSKPSLGDLDGDGDLDLVTGAQDGMFRVHYFPEPARGLLLGAGLALLGVLERLRRRG